MDSLLGVQLHFTINHVNFDDFTEAFPAFITMAVMPFSTSIADGIAAGFLAYIVAKVAGGQFKEVHWLMYVLGIIGILHFLPF